jgi:GNAT superfamily N-acetyltransferase
MCDDWMPVIKLPLTLDQFHQMPRHPGYKYEYFDKHALLTPRPKFYHAVLDFQTFCRTEPPLEEIRMELVQDEHLPDLERLFAAAFHRHQPYASLEDERRHEAARQALEKVRKGGDGPWIRTTSFVAVEESQRIVGAIFITLLPDEDPADWDSFHWPEPPPDDLVARGLGRPHLTWIFVRPWNVGNGVGTALLTASIEALGKLGYRQLASTFMMGNESSMLWHWRNGFKLQAYPASRRRQALLRQFKEAKENQ